MKITLRTGLRFSFALLFLTTAVGKLLDNRGFAGVLGTYQLFPAGLLLPLALSISLGELYLGTLLLLGRKDRGCSLAVLAANFSYLVLAVTTLGRGVPVANCGCFGVFLARPLTWATVVEDGIIVALSVVFFRAPKKISAEPAPGSFVRAA